MEWEKIYIYVLDIETGVWFKCLAGGCKVVIK